MNSLPRTTPESVGIDPRAVSAWLDALESATNRTRAVMVLRHGQVAAEGWWAPFTPDQPHLLYSLSKSFTSTAAGVAIQEGFFGLDDQVLSFFPEYAPDRPSKHLEQMTVRHLLTMSTGHATEPPCRLHGDLVEPWTKLFLHHPVQHEPGTKFLYNSPATYMVSAIVQRTTGQTLTQFLTPRLYGPLGIESHEWQQDPSGVDVGGWGLSLTAESVAKFGLLMLQRGVWMGEQLVPAEWIDLATTKQVANDDEHPPHDWSQGYGYQFWMCRHGAYRADGAFGQFCVVVPHLDLVVVMFNCSDDLGRTLNTIWDVLLPGVSTGHFGGDPELAGRLADLQTFTEGSDVAKWSGDFEDDDGSVVKVGPDAVTIWYGELELEAPFGKWKDQMVTVEGWAFHAGVRASWAEGAVIVEVLDIASPLFLRAELCLNDDVLAGKVECKGVFNPNELTKFRLIRRS